MHIRRISTVKKIVSAIMEVAARRFGGQALIWVICAHGALLLWPSQRSDLDLWHREIAAHDKGRKVRTVRVSHDAAGAREYPGGRIGRSIRPGNPAGSSWAGILAPEPVAERERNRMSAARNAAVRGVC
jgi:hypothetical protein